MALNYYLYPLQKKKKMGDFFYHCLPMWKQTFEPPKQIVLTFLTKIRQQQLFESTDPSFQIKKTMSTEQEKLVSQGKNKIQATIS